MSTLTVGTIKNPDGSVRPFARGFMSGEYQLAAAALIEIPHTLGVEPEHFAFRAVCKVAEHGWSPGEWFIPAMTPDTYSVVVGNAVWADAAKICIRCASQYPLYILHKSTGVGHYATLANWPPEVRLLI